MARPIPREAPVTRAVLLSRSGIVSNSSLRPAHTPGSTPRMCLPDETVLNATPGNDCRRNNCRRPHDVTSLVPLVVSAETELYATLAEISDHIELRERVAVA